MPRALTRTMTALSVVAPPLAAELAFGLWGWLGRPAAVHPRDRAVHDRAVPGELQVGGARVATYRWGSGPRVILLVHGWRSRASRFSQLVEALESPGRTILAFDAPGNGASGGHRVTVLDYAQAIRQLGKQYGTFETIVGHSFGVLSSFLAVREGVAARSIVDISGMYNADHLVRQFSWQLGLRKQAERRLRRRIERRTFPTVTNPWSRFVTEVEPTDRLPIMVIHDADDPMVPVAEAAKIAEAHLGDVTTLITSGLGHSRILGDPQVVAAVSDFVTRVETRAPTRSPRRS